MAVRMTSTISLTIFKELGRKCSKNTVNSTFIGTWCRFKSTKGDSESTGEPIMVESADKQMIVCYHPTEDFPYEHSKPISRPDPSKPEDSAEGMLRVKFKSKSWSKERQGPSIEELSEMFYTTKHRWYPLGIRKRSLAKSNPPRDRPVF